MSRKIAPGGYVEFQDYGCEMFTRDGTRLDGLIPEHPVTRYMHSTSTAAERARRPLVMGRGMAERMEKAGFVDVQQRAEIWPLGSWPKQKDMKELGKWGGLAMKEGAYPFALMLLNREGWSKEEIKEMTDATVTSILKNTYYAQVWFVYGRKPEA